MDWTPEMLTEWVRVGVPEFREQLAAMDADMLRNAAVVSIANNDYGRCRRDFVYVECCRRDRRDIWHSAWDYCRRTGQVAKGASEANHN